MTALHPTFEFTEDAMVHVAESLLAGGRSMKHCPTFYFGVEMHQEAIHWRVKVLFEGGFDLGQESLHVPLRRLYQQLAAVFLKVLAQEIEAFFNVRDSGFVL
jgi:hypothetical protein